MSPSNEPACDVNITPLFCFFRAANVPHGPSAKFLVENSKCMYSRVSK